MVRATSLKGLWGVGVELVLAKLAGPFGEAHPDALEAFGVFDQPGVDQTNALTRIGRKTAATDAQLAAWAPASGVVRVVVGGALVSRQGDVRSFTLRGARQRRSGAPPGLGPKRGDCCRFRIQVNCRLFIKGWMRWPNLSTPARKSSKVRSTPPVPGT